MKYLFAIAMALSLAGCVSPEPMVTTLDPASLEYIRETGTASIEAQAFARQRGGGVVTAAGEEVLLIPATPYTRELTAKMVAGTAPPDAAAPIRSFKRTTIADADGRFTSSNLKAGSYLILALVRWEVPSQYGAIPQGGPMRREVTVAEGEHASVIMAR